MDRALIVMAKQPAAGGTKTRLSPPLSSQEAADLYRCFMLDTLELVRRVACAQPVIAYSPSDARPYFGRVAPPGFHLVEQVGADLGERLDRVTTACLQGGYRQVVVVGSDSPTLPTAYVRQAFDELDDSATDVVLGPADDGGYYLIGLKSPCPFLFREVTMSTFTVLVETLALAEKRGLRAACLPAWYDVDRHQDLLRLSAELASLPDHVAAHTRALLSPGGKRGIIAQIDAGGTVIRDRYAVVLVYSTSYAIRAEQILHRAGLTTKLIPVPRHLSSDCGVCLRIERADVEAAQQALAGARVEIQGIHEI